jgi:YD repeat-containing protein
VKQLFLFFFLSFSGMAISQVLDNRNGDAFTDKPFFNSSFIKENQLKLLKGTFVYKKQGEVMRNTTFNYVYAFDRNGNLEYTFETRTDDGSTDTTWNRYAYDEKGRLSVFRKSDQTGYSAIHYMYDEQDRVVAEEYFTELTDSLGNVIRTLAFNKDTYVYSDYDSQVKRVKFNNYDLPYMEEFFNYNKDGYLVERIERIKMTSDVFTFHYGYNEQGKLATVVKTSNKSSEPQEELKFKYDELGNLIEKHIYKNGIFTTDVQIIYNSKSRLLSSVITRQVSTNFMMILRFLDYEFYD